MALLFFCLSLAAQSQKVTVTGKILDQTGLPVIGASVIEDGTQNGAITDLDGNYILEVTQGATMTVSSIGYKDIQLTVTSGQTVYNATLQEDSELLDEVVVVGYGTMKRSDLSGASVSVSEDALKGSVISSGKGGRSHCGDDFRSSWFLFIHPRARSGHHQRQC